jgi:hypothetical protein
MHPNLKQLEKIINSQATCQEEREELWKIVDEIVHHRIVGCLLENLEKEKHEEVLSNLGHYTPTPEIKIKIEKALENIELEILQEIS